MSSAISQNLAPVQSLSVMINAYARRPTTVVDVGGSHGLIAIELARAFPALQLVVQDLDEPVVRDGDARKPPEVAGRVRFMVHDFLTPQPVRAAAYYFRSIFHNWPDRYCVEILRALVPALEPGAKVVVNDSVMPGPGTLPWDREARLRGSDLNMLELQNAGELLWPSGPVYMSVGFGSTGPSATELPSSFPSNTL